MTKRDKASARASNSSVPPNDASASSLRLDDLLARLLQLSASDTPELESLREELLEAARDTEVPDEVRTLTAEAVLKLDELLYGSKSASGDEVLSAVAAGLGRALESESITQQNPEKTNAPPRRTSDSGSLVSARSKSVKFDLELPPDTDTDLLRDFVTESLEQIEAAEASLLALEVDPDDMEAINTVFRAFHTIKGTSGFLGLTAIKELAHGAESLLSRVREGEVRYSGRYADLSLRSVDVVKELIHSVDGALAGEDLFKPDEYDGLLELLFNPEAVLDGTDEAGEGMPRLGDLLVSQGKIQREDLEQVISGKPGERIGEALIRSGKAKTSDVARSLRTQRKLSQPEESVVDSSVRVRTDRLDRLIDMVGELVIAHSMVAQDETVADGKHQELSRKASQVGKIVRELQDLSMSLRMVPLRPAFQKVNRLVRDLSQKAGKRVLLEKQGEETEIDRNMVDVIRDPLVHMVRNAIDHGIELPGEREVAGKPQEGHLRLSAYHSGGSVVVELKDDGRGLDKAKIIDKALRLRLIDSAAGMSDTEIHNLIFQPGFSTADQVTDVSGRGVGMDVVKKNIETFRGRIEITSEPGRGCCFKIVLPLTMAITDGMLVQVGDERYIIPTVSIIKTFRPQPSQLSTIAGRGEMVMLRGELLPVYRLHRLFDIRGAVEDPTQGLLVVLSVGESKYGLLVDQLLGQQQVVAKSLPRAISRVGGLSGAAILGDGRVGLILEGSELGAMARQDLTEGAPAVRSEAASAAVN